MINDEKSSNVDDKPSQVLPKEFTGRTQFIVGLESHGLSYTLLSYLMMFRNF
jgi:hypothetical protein